MPDLNSFVRYGLLDHQVRSYSFFVSPHYFVKRKEIEELRLAFLII